MSDYEKSLKAANEQLMTCPFCGGNAKISDSLIHCGKQMYQPLCLDCDAELGYFDNLGEAVAAWNTRTAVPHEMTAREYLETEARMCKYYGLPSAFDMSGFTVDEAISMVEKFAQEYSEEANYEQ